MKPPRQIVYVISDLHLGGAPAYGSVGSFQICPPPTHAMLADFVLRLCEEETEASTHLVVAGDIVDFLAEKPFAAFSGDQIDAGKKFTRILEQTEPVWAALRAFSRDPRRRLTLLLGNHDIELSLPAVRSLLLERLESRSVQFLYDNEAYTLGPLLVEHGNRFDPWNAVSHGALRRVRSQLSRGAAVSPAFPAPPGSRLVADVMNPLKERYPFVDLLKPEDAAALPILAALGATGLKDVWRFLTRYRQTWSRDYDEDREPIDEELIAAASTIAEQLYFDTATEIMDLSASEEIASGELGRTRLEALLRAFRVQKDRHSKAFDVTHEDQMYLAPARRAAAAGYKVVVYGHTHLAKRVPLEKSPTSPVYLNSGTWADLMCVPGDIWHPEEKHARLALASFVADLEQGTLARWRRAVPTYARMELQGNQVNAADVHFYDSGESISTQGLMKRMVWEPSP